MKKLSVSLSLVVVLTAGTVFGSYGTRNGWFDFMPYMQETSTSENSGADFLPAKYNIDLSLFWTVWDMLENSYLKADQLDTQNMTYGAIKGMVSSLGDPYTVFMDPVETKEFTQSLDQQLEGIGAELTTTDGKLTIVTPIRNSPAEKAGLLPGDVIFKINEEFSSDMTLFDAIKKIRGPKGTTVKLTIVREKMNEPFEVTILREQINLENVTKKDLGGEIVYISINQFTGTTASEFGAAISDLILNKPKGLIIDLRNNGGGYLDASTDVLSYLFEADIKVSSTKDRGQNSQMVPLYTKSGGEKLLNVPVVVLINEGSASASEIVAGAIQDLKRGIILGTKSFGKGTVQSVEPLEDGSSLRMTIAQWFTPNGREIDEIGITPDIVVENSVDEVKEGVDRQLDEAEKYLKGL